MPSFSAISGMVMPSMISLFDSIQRKLKKYPKKYKFLLTYCIFFDTIINR
jgi:hypothetical protein